MSKLTSIEFKNMKGQTAVQELTGLDIFTGRNGAGKTTRVQALSYAMLGYVPGQKKNSADTFKLATGNIMSVGLKTETFAFNRTLTKTDKKVAKTGETTTSIKESLTLSPGAGERTDTDKKQRVSEEMGNFPVMLDFGEFLAMTDTARRDFIYSLSSIESDIWNREKLHKYLVEKLLSNELQKNDPEQYLAMEENITKAISEYPIGYAISDGLQAMLDWAEREKSFWSAKQKDALGAVRQISDQKNELEETERGIADRKIDLSNLQNELINVEKDISSIIEKQKAADKKNSRILELTNGLEELKNLPKIELGEIDKQLQGLQLKITDVPDISTELKDIFEKNKVNKAEISKLNQERNNLGGTVATIKSTIDTLDMALKQIGSMEGRCVAHSMVKCPKDFSDPLLLEGVAKNKEAADNKIAEINIKISSLDNELKVLNDKEESLVKRRQELEESVRNANEINKNINIQIAEISSKKNELTKTISERESKLNIYQDELNKLKAEEIEPIEDFSEKTNKAAELRSKIIDLSATIESKEQAKQALILVQQSMIENRKSELNAICLKEIYEKLGPKGVQGELVKEILEPIRADIENNLGLMGFNFKPFFQTESETGKEIFQFGWINEKNHEVNFDALSTGQQTVFLAAMMVTIIDRAEPKTRILLMDNLNHLDRVNFQMLVDGLSKVKDKLDNIILAGAIEFDFKAEGWMVWDLNSDSEKVNASA